MANESAFIEIPCEVRAKVNSWKGKLNTVMLAVFSIISSVLVYTITLYYLQINPYPAMDLIVCLILNVALWLVVYGFFLVSWIERGRRETKRIFRLPNQPPSSST